MENKQYIINKLSKNIYSNYKTNLYIELLEHFKNEGFENIKGQLNTNIGLTEIILDDSIIYKVQYVDNVNSWRE